MNSSTSLRERKKADTRRRLMTVALRLFEERGFNETTVEEIAAAADVAPRTFFRYFPTKVDVLFGDHQELVTLIRDALANRPPDEPIIQALRQVMHVGLSQVQENPELFLTRMRLTLSIPAAHAHNRLLDLDYENAITEAVAAGRGADPASDLYARMVGKLAWSANLAASEVWLASNASRDPRELIDEAFDLIENGITPTP